MTLPAWRVLFGAAVAVQSLVLYSPRTPGVSSGLPLDKAVHFTIFAAVAALAIRAGLHPMLAVALLLCQALASEVVQGLMLPERGGDPADFAADVLGIAVGIFLGQRWVGGARAQ